MLNIATVFSGIGSVEYALKRMNIPHNIVFACDNGDIVLNDIDEKMMVENLKSIELGTHKKKIVDDYFSKSRRTNFVKQSYFANYNIEEEKWHNDVRFIDGKQFANKVDLFVGGSPCQSFSIMGYQRGLEDTRGTLFYDFARLVDEIRPKVFIYENVQGLTKHDGGKTWSIMKNVFEDLDYDIHYSLLDAVNYGIPQKRRRIFVVGFLNESKEFKFPKEVPLIFKLQDFLLSTTSEGNFRSVNSRITIRKEESKVSDKYTLSEKVKAHVMSTGTGNYYTKPEIDLEIARPLLSTMHKMHRAGVDNYISLQNGNIRKLTPRECLRLMGFDDQFKIVVSDTQLYRQAGNSIVVDVFIHLLDSIFEATDILDK